MCTGRIDLAFIMRAFSKGADGVFIGGCWPGECHYITEGNYDALGNVHLSRRFLKHLGINPERLRIEWIAASEGSRFAEIMDDFGNKLKELGPVGKTEGIDEKQLKLKFEAVNEMIPDLKLIARERLKIPEKSEEAYNQFYASEEVDQLFNELIDPKLISSQIKLLLKEGPHSTAEISEILGLNPSEILKYMNGSPDHVHVWEMIAYHIDPAKCMACMICLRKCPFEAIDGGKKKIHIINQDKCTKCGTCFEVCPDRFGAVKQISGAPIPPPVPEEERTVKRKPRSKRKSNN